jgi:hypothetical protein
MDAGIRKSVGEGFVSSSTNLHRATRARAVITGSFIAAVGEPMAAETPTVTVVDEIATFAYCPSTCVKESDLSWSECSLDVRVSFLAKGLFLSAGEDETELEDVCSAMMELFGNLRLEETLWKVAELPADAVRESSLEADCDLVWELRENVRLVDMIRVEVTESNRDFNCPKE